MALRSFTRSPLTIQIYFAHPYSPWERGSNKPPNSLIREFMLKGTSMKNYTDAYISEVQTALNNRLRKLPKCRKGLPNCHTNEIKLTLTHTAPCFYFT